MKKKYIYLGLGQRLKEYRKNLTQKEFASKIGVPLVTYQRYESGDGLPPEPVLKLVEKLCGKTADWIPVYGKVLDPAAGYDPRVSTQYSFLAKFGLLSKEEKEFLEKTMEVLRGTSRVSANILKGNIELSHKSCNDVEEDASGTQKKQNHAG